VENGMIRIGRVAGPHGVRGWIKVRPDGAEPEAFSPGRQIRLTGRDGSARTAEIREARPHGNLWRLRLAEVEDRDAAERLAGAGIFVPREELPEPEADSFYWADLIGLRVYDGGGIGDGPPGSDPSGAENPDGGPGRFLGRLESIIETGSNDVYVVRDGDRETLVPALAWVVENVDLAAGVMRVNLPEGL
jgi:16S rRNA processing protein RimM